MGVVDRGVNSKIGMEWRGVSVCVFQNSVEIKPSCAVLDAEACDAEMVYVLTRAFSVEVCY